MFHFRFPLLPVLLLVFSQIGYAQNTKQQVQQWNTKQSSRFTENKGQLTDQHGKLRNDVKYIYSAPGFKAIFKPHSFSYEVYTVEKKPIEPSASVTKYSNNLLPERFSKPSEIIIKTNRIDIELPGANNHPEMVAEGKSTDYNNYYLAHTPEAGVQNVYSYNKLTYKNIWPKIDLIFYAKKEGELKYDIVVHPGGDIKKVMFLYSGLDILSIENGKLKQKTPLAFINESIPSSYTLADKKPVKISFALQGNRVSFAGDYNKNKTLVIDPQLSWSTYYGGNQGQYWYESDDDYVSTIQSDGGKFIYLMGHTISTLSFATSGAHQSTHYGGFYDLYIAKFNSAGVRQWGTYYGGEYDEYGGSFCLDKGGDMYIVATTQSDTAIATSFAHQTSIGQSGGLNSMDGILAKFNNAGKRIWATYYGGSGSDYAYGVKLDGFGSVYISGYTMSTDGIASSNAFLNYAPGGFDAFFVRFDTSGARKWSTYFGGNDDELSSLITSDGFGNVYFAGNTYSISNIATLGAHQTSIGSWVKRDAFMVKFDSSGTRKWATYYGGKGDDGAGSIKCDGKGNIYLIGSTNSTNAIASIGAHYDTLSKYSNMFLTKFDSLGKRIWGTYLGGYNLNEGAVYGNFSAGDGTNLWWNDDFSFWIIGVTKSADGVAMPGAVQSTKGNDEDAYIVKYDTLGRALWSSYYGGNGYDYGISITCDSLKNVYIAGVTNSTDLATAGAHQTGFGGIYLDVFFARFDYVDKSLDAVMGVPEGLCATDSFQISAVLRNHYKAADSNVKVIALFTGPDTLIITDSLTIAGKQIDTLIFKQWVHLSKPGNYKLTTFIGSYTDDPYNDTVKNSFIIYQNATPNFKALYNCHDTLVQLENNSYSCSDSITYLWYFGDGDSSTLKNPEKKYANYGNYDIKLLVFTEKGKDSLTKPVYYYPKPKADFSFTVNCLDSSIKVKNLSNVYSDSISKFRWDFGDGSTSTSTLKDLKHNYKSSGTYKVKLFVETDSGCKDSFTETIFIYPKPHLDFSFDGSCQNRLVSFHNLTTVAGGTIHNLWNFGDGDTSTATHPTHVYDSAGIFTVTLKTTNNKGCTDSFQSIVKIYPTPQTTFSVAYNYSDSMFYFENRTTIKGDTVAASLWSFGDGNSAVTENPVHIYKKPGRYTVKLISVTKNGCKDSAMQDVVVHPKPKAAFITYNSCLNHSSNFTNNSKIDSGTIKNYQWDFGDGDTSNLENPTHTYSALGQYKVTLKATSSFGCTDTFSRIVTVYPLPKANFSTSNICIQDIAYFTDSSISAQQYIWDFGDGNYSVMQNPKHKYAKAGNYTVTQKVRNIYGCWDSTSKQIEVYDRAESIFSVNDICVTDTFQFTSQGKGATQWHWKFGDDAYSFDEHPKYKYSSAGRYDVWLIVSNNNGCKDSVMHTITVDSSCVWPGDANADKVVDNKDILAIGLAYADTGTARIDTSTLWKAHLVKNWSNNFSSGQNYKHADSDGSGIVSYNDTLAVTRNYTKTHAKKQQINRGKSGDPVLKIDIQNDSLKAGDTLVAYIQLGENALPAKDVYGIAFSIDYNRDLFSAPVVDFSGSWFGNNILSYSNTTNGLDIALTRTDKKNITGSGRIATVKMIVQKDVQARQEIKLEITDNLLISANEKVIEVFAIDDSVQTYKEPNSIYNSAKKEPLEVKVYPNPFNTQTIVEYTLPAAGNVNIWLMDMNGKTYHITNTNMQPAGKHQLLLDAEAMKMKAGIYVIRIEAGGTTAYKRIVKLK